MSEKKAETKRQHYVPRFILKNWSRDKKRISVVLLSRGGLRKDGVGLRDQCAKPYFYDTDNVLEKSFAAEEGKIAGYLGDLSAQRLAALPGDPALYDVRQFVHYQRMRTAAAAAEIEERADAMMRSVMGTTIDLNQGKLPFTKDDLDSVRIKLTNPQGEALWAAAGGVPLLLDLLVKFIVTDRTPGFVISDHPVVAYNQWAEQHRKFRRYRGITGLSAKGLQFFMPVSPRVTIAVFDPSTYSFGSDNSVVCTPGPRDIRFLNEMQAVNAESCVYFDPERITEEELDHLKAVRSAHPPMRTAKIFESPPARRGDGKLSSFVAVTGQDLKVGASFSFGRIKDRRSFGKYDGAVLPVRSDELMMLAEMYQSRLDQRVKDQLRKRPPNAG